MKEMTKSLSKISLKSSSKQTDYEKFSSLWTICMVKFSNFLLGQKFVAVEFENAKIGPKKANFAKGAHLYPCQTAPTSLSHYFEWKYA